MLCSSFRILLAHYSDHFLHNAQSTLANPFPPKANIWFILTISLHRLLLCMFPFIFSSITKRSARIVSGELHGYIRFARLRDKSPARLPAAKLPLTPKYNQSCPRFDLDLVLISDCVRALDSEKCGSV